ncbi:MAG TPA: hypothetical protein VGM92_13075 [Candidatus Kapabacteria bacterium]
MKKLIILGMLALGLSVAAPQAHSQVRVQVRTHTRVIRPRVGLSVQLGTPGYRYYRPSETVIINRHDRWHRREWARRHRYARMGFGR